MGSGASAIKNDEIPESMDLGEAKQWASLNLDIKEEDWPEEKWLELSGTEGTISRNDIVKLFEELSLPRSGDEQTVPSTSMDEEVFASDGIIDSGELAQGTFNEDVDDGLDLGGMMIPDLAVMGDGKSDISANNNAAEQLLEPFKGDEEEEIFAADGEAFESSSGPGCFDDDEAVGEVSTNGLEVTGSPAK